MDGTISTAQSLKKQAKEQNVSKLFSVHFDDTERQVQSFSAGVRAQCWLNRLDFGQFIKIWNSYTNWKIQRREQPQNCDWLLGCNVNFGTWGPWQEADDLLCGYIEANQTKKSSTNTKKKTRVDKAVDEIRAQTKYFDQLGVTSSFSFKLLFDTSDCCVNRHLKMCETISLSMSV